MKHLPTILLAVALAAGSSAPALAQQVQGGLSAQAPSTALTEGEVRKVDKQNGKITLKHGEIRNLDMPPMTMVFGVADAAVLDKVKAGDKVRFRAANLDGRLTVTEIQPVQ